MEDHHTLLHIEDDDRFAALVRVLLLGSGFTVDRTRSLADGERAAAEGTHACALVDLTLADATGLQAVIAVRAAAPDLPIVVLSGAAPDTAPLKAVLLGAQEWVGKHELSSERLLQAVSMAMARQDAQAQLVWQATHDNLTGLPNRALGLEHLTRALGRAGRGDHSVAVLFCDLDSFKPINDEHGHMTGDAVLTAVAQRLIAAVRPGDVVARWGGDEFVVIAEGVGGADDALAIASRTRHAAARPLTVGDVRFAPTISIGVGLGTGHSDPHDLLADADRAMLEAKRTQAGVFVAGDAAPASYRLLP